MNLLDANGQPLVSTAAVSRDYSFRKFDIEELAAELHHSGVSSLEKVPPEAAIRVPAVAACVRILSTGLSQLPLKMYKRAGADGLSREEAKAHPLWKPLTQRANSYQHPSKVMLQLTRDAALHGNGYAQLIKSGKRLIGIYPIKHSSCTPKQHDDWSIEYKVEQGHGKSMTLQQDDVLHIRGPYPDSYKSMSPVELCPNAIAFCIVAERFGIGYFKEGGKSKGGFRMTTPGALNDKAYDRLKEQIAEMVAQWRPPLLEDGLEYFRMDNNAKDSQFLELRQFQLTEIARMFGVQPHLIQDLTRSTNNNIEHQGREFIQMTMSYWIKEWQTAVQLQLMDEKDLDDFYPEYNVDAYTAGDTKSQTEMIQKLVGGPIMTRNEARKMRNMPSVEGGDVLIEPANMQDIGSGDDDPDDDQDPSDPDPEDT